jgi:hypothetical protein
MWGFAGLAADTRRDAQNYRTSQRDARAARRFVCHRRDKTRFQPVFIFTQDSRYGSRRQSQYLVTKSLLLDSTIGLFSASVSGRKLGSARRDNDQRDRSFNQVRSVCRAQRRGHFHVSRTLHSPDHVERASRPGRTGHEYDPGTPFGMEYTFGNGLVRPKNLVPTPTIGLQLGLSTFFQKPQSCRLLKLNGL